MEVKGLRQTSRSSLDNQRVYLSSGVPYKTAQHELLGVDVKTIFNFFLIKTSLN